MSEKNEPPKATEYELPVGAIAMLEEILPSPTWYKDDSKQAVLITRGVAALDALPDLPKRPKPESGEEKTAFDARVDEWAKPGLTFEWSDKQRDTVKVCVRHYLKQGSFLVNSNTVALLRMLQLDDE